MDKQNKFASIAIILLVIVALAIVAAIFWRQKSSPVPVPTTSSPTSTLTQPVFDAKNSTFTINGKPITLINGITEVPIPNSSARVITRYFGNETKGNISGNGTEDVAFLVTQDTGGSGVFYYVVAALKTANGYKTTNAFLVGDRIAPQTTHIQSDTRELYVNYAGRKPNEPMTAQPSVGATLILKVTVDSVLKRLMK